MKKLTTLLLALLAYLLLFPAQALAGARSGLMLWYHSVLPVLFPFMLLSSILMRFNLPDRVLPCLSRPFRFLFGSSPYGTFAILSGFLCGFPMGARITSDLLAQGKISQEESRHLYGFVNNLSPSFVLSFLAADQMGLPAWGGLFLFNILGSALIYGLLTAHRSYRNCLSAASGRISADESPREQTPHFDLRSVFQILDSCIYSSIENTVRLGAYIVMFSILSSAALYFVPIRHPLALFLVSCIEVSNGVHLIAASPLPLFMRYLMVNALGAFGGLSALAQTASIAAMNRELFLYYIKSRVKITLLCLLSSTASVLLFRRFLF